MICSKCGKEINDESIICNFCGKKIKRGKPFFKNKRLLFIIGGCLLFILISVAVILFLIIPGNTLAAFSSENQSGNYQNAYVLFKNTCDSNSINSGIIKLSGTSGWLFSHLNDIYAMHIVNIKIIKRKKVL
jgi:hypothetical protein